MEKKETITIAVYKEDWEKLKELCKKDETFRNKFHEIIDVMDEFLPKH